MELARYRMAVAQALGQVHEPDMGAPWPCSDEEALEGIRLNPRS